MLLGKHGMLLKNERLKLYKKPSTWILMGVIVLLTLIGVVLTQVMFSLQSSFSFGWQEQYDMSIDTYKTNVRDNPDDVASAQTVEALKYLLDHNISPQDWRTDVVFEYYNLKTYQLIEEQAQTEEPIYDPSFEGENGYTDYSQTTAEQRQARLLKLESLLNSNDWQEFVRLKIEDLKSGWTPLKNTQEKQVNIEMYELYLKNNITPVADPNNNQFYSNYSATELSWKSQQIESVRQNKLNLLRGEDSNGIMLTNTRMKALESEIDVALKRLSTDTAPVTYDSFLGQLESAASSIGLLSILLIVYAANIFASEYSSGTIKLLLITPHKRKRIFWSKTVLMLELSGIALAANFLFAFLISGAFTAFKGAGSMQVLSLFGNVVQMPYLIYIVFKYLLMMLPVFVYGALAMMMSVVTRKSAISIAVTIMLMFGSDIIMSIVSLFSTGFVIPGIKFLLFANTTLENYLPSAMSAITGAAAPVDATMTLGFSIVILILYMGCFLWIARDSFCRRDVK
jgi:ABC-2 type transport system permease protein